MSWRDRRNIARQRSENRLKAEQRRCRRREGEKEGRWVGNSEKKDRFENVRVKRPLFTVCGMSQNPSITAPNGERTGLASTDLTISRLKTLELKMFCN